MERVRHPVLAMVVAVLFLVGYSGLVFAQQQQPQAGAAKGAAAKEGAEAGAAAAAGVSTGTIVAGVIAAAAIAAIAASSGGGGGAEAVTAAAPTPSGVASGLASAGLTASELLALYDAFTYNYGTTQTLADILAGISYEDFQAALQDLGLTLGKQDLINWLNNLKQKNLDAYNRLVQVLKKLAQNKELFDQVKALASDSNKLAEFKAALQQQVQQMLTQQHPGYTVQFTYKHIGGGIYTTQYHLVKQQ